MTVQPLGGASGQLLHTGFSAPRVAIVHYWFVGMRGGERVVERLLRLFPQADLFTHVYDPDSVSATIRRSNVSTTFINRLPFSRKAYQYYLPFMPMALEELDLTKYDIVISSESGPAKGVITHPSSMHLCYCHSPMRYLWDHYHQYRAEAGLAARIAMPWMYHRLRQWDVSSSARVDRFAANSRFVSDRIRKNWRREAEVVHPPVEIDLFSKAEEVEDRYLWIGQMVPYKRPDIAVDAFNKSGKSLLMVGTGSMLAKLKSRANSNIAFVDRLDFDALRKAYAACRALVFTAEEDFGIIPVEVMASGRPVVAYGKGGALDTVLQRETGVLFPEQSAESLLDGIEEFERWEPHFSPNRAISYVRKFAPEHFDRKIAEMVLQ